MGVFLGATIRSVIVVIVSSGSGYSNSSKSSNSNSSYCITSLGTSQVGVFLGATIRSSSVGSSVPRERKG